MNLMDWVQIALLVLLLLLVLQPVYRRWLPRRWQGLLHRLLPAQVLKSEGEWRRKSSETDKKH